MARKFRTEQAKKKKPINWGVILIALFVAVIMITSILGFMWKEDENKQKYGDYVFKRTRDGWTLSIKLSQDSKPSILRFDFLPQEVDGINISEGSISRLGSAPMFYMTYDSSNMTPQFSEGISLAQFEIQQMLWQEKKIYTQLGFTVESKEFPLPVITCANATQSVPVVEFRPADTTGVYEDGGCIIFEAESPADFIVLKDRLLYGIFGVIK